MADKFNFTKVRIEALPTPAKRTYYRDTKERRLGLYVLPSGRKSYFAQMCIDGKTRRVQLGKHPDLSVTRARQLCAKVMSELAEHAIDPVAKRRERKAASVTLREALDTYIRERTLKPLTVKDYKRATDELCGDWLDKPLSSIKPDDVLRRYLLRGKKSKARTDNGLRVLRALFNFAQARHKKQNGDPLILTNPTRIVSETRTRFKPRRRQRIIAASDLPSWWQAVNSLDNHAERDWLLFMLFTGCRSTESATLTWENIDLRGRAFTLTDTKNKRTPTLPLPNTIAALLRQRCPASGSGWAFPSRADDSKHLSDPREVIKHLRRETGIAFSPHDLRRTFTSISNGLDISVYSVKALLNHTVNSSDITAGYDVPDLERLRSASARIETKILSLAHAQDAKVVPLRGV